MLLRNYANKRHQLKYQMVSQRNSTNSFQGIENDRKIPNFLYTANIVLIFKPNKKSTKKKTYKLISLTNIDNKSNKITSLLLSNNIHDCGRCIPGIQRWFSIRIPINIIFHINRFGKKNLLSPQVLKEPIIKIHPFMMKIKHTCICSRKQKL